VAKVLIAEDDPLTRSGIEVLLSNSDYEVVSSVGDGQQVIGEAAAKRPDLMILDLSMPGKDGIELLRHFRERGDLTPIVFLTGGLSGQRAWEALQNGLNGLVIKSKAPASLVDCLDAVSRGRKWIDHEILSGAMEVSISPQGKATSVFAALTSREFGIVSLVKRGLRNKDIADQLCLSESTVKSHLHNIFDKLGVKSRAELIILDDAQAPRGYE
jgi:two-component system, NarL family, nitrate/nitrite response regulator NarL